MVVIWACATVLLAVTAPADKVTLRTAARSGDLSQPYMAHVLRLSRTEPLRMLRGPSS